MGIAHLKIMFQGINTRIRYKLFFFGGLLAVAFLGNLAYSQNQEVNFNQQLIIDLGQPKEPSRWFVVNDGVMGGRSFGMFQSFQQNAKFSGEISLDNNGGFSSVYRPLNNFNRAYDKVTIDIIGDGQTYQLRTASNIQGYRVAYKHEFTTRVAERQTLEFQLDDFEATFRGRLISNAPKLTETEIREVGFLMTKKQPGEFALQINQIIFHK